MTSLEKNGRPFHHGDLRNALLKIARRLVREHGPEGFSLREAAREAGVSPNAAYRHFADKRALLAELARRGFVALAADMERSMAAAGDDPIARIWANGLAYVRFAQRDPDLFSLMFGPFGAGAGRDAMVVPGPQSGIDAFGLLGSALDGLVTAGYLAPGDRPGADDFLWSVVHGLATLTMTGVLTEPVEAAFARMYPLMARGINVRPPAPPPPKRKKKA